MDVKTVEIACCNCGLTWWITAQHEAELRRLGTDFYCPAGHRQAYTNTDEKKLAALRAKKTELQNTVASQTETIRSRGSSIVVLKRQRAAQQAQATKARRRAAKASAEADRFRAELEAVRDRLRRSDSPSLTERRTLAQNIGLCLRWDRDAEKGEADV